MHHQTEPACQLLTFGALAEEWQESCSRLAARRLEATWFLLDKYVLPELGGYMIPAADVERAISAVTARGLARSTRRRALSIIRLVLDYAIRN